MRGGRVKIHARHTERGKREAEKEREINIQTDRQTEKEKGGKHTNIQTNIHTQTHTNTQTHLNMTKKYKKQDNFLKFNYKYTQKTYIHTDTTTHEYKQTNTHT